LNAPEVIIIDYGVGNLLSVQRGLERVGAKVLITGDPERILAAARVVLPGVGAFGNAMHELNRLHLVDAIRDVAARGTPLLGICLGMQLLLDESDEFGVTVGLRLIPGRVIPVPTHTVSGERQKIPHIGWNALLPTTQTGNWHGTLLRDNRPGEAVYFVHSFMDSPTDPSDRIADCVYGGHRIAAVIGRGNIIGCQFHPEKSGEVGLKLLRNFVSQ